MFRLQTPVTSKVSENGAKCLQNYNRVAGKVDLNQRNFKYLKNNLPNSISLPLGHQHF